MENLKKLSIKIPVYTSKAIETDADDLFAITNQSLLEGAKIKIASFNIGSEKPLMITKRTKTTAIGINKIEPIDIKFNEDLCLLLKVTAYKTNLTDGYYQSSGNSETEIRFNLDDKLCSDTYFFILYPQVDRLLVNKKTSSFWHIFLYEDPSKENEDMISIARKIMKYVLEVPIKNIKSEQMLSELKKFDLISEMKITLSSISDDKDDIPTYLEKYSITSKLKKEKQISLSNITKDDAINTFKDESFTSSYSKRQLKFITHNQRVFSLVQEFKDKLTSTFEDSFNYSVDVEEKDVEKGTIFQPEVIKKNVEGIFTKYMNATNDE